MIYNKASTDSGAPVFNGAIGSLITLLDYCLVTTAGWSKEYSGTNIATYRAAGGNQMRLGVDDTAANDARIRGFESMTAAGVAVASGSGPFPTDAQQSGGCYMPKSTDTGTTRAWRFIGNDRAFYLFWYRGDYQCVIFFGDIKSNKAGDAYNTVLLGGISASTYTASVCNLTSNIASTITGNFLCRAYTQTGGSVNSTKVTDASMSQATWTGQNGVTYPAPIEGGLLLSPIRVAETVGIRGVLPGAWSPVHPTAFTTHGDTFTGSGDLSGRTFFIGVVLGTVNVLIETSDTWYT